MFSSDLRNAVEIEVLVHERQIDPRQDRVAEAKRLIAAVTRQTMDHDYGL